jgi:hypothetical protein
MRSFLFGLASLLSTAAAAQSPPDFVLTEDFLHQLAQSSAAVIDMPVVLTHRTNNVHALGNDCEMHLAGTPTGTQLADPYSVVVEPPNLCKFGPPTGASWGALFDTNVINQSCVATGYPRIFTEHAASGSAGGANPNHVLEIHPAIRLTCGSSVIDFTSDLTYFPGMRSIRPETADDCVRNRAVSIRYDATAHRYEVLEDGGTCGNFAMAEVGYVQPKWIQAINGGHTAIARVSLDGESRTTLKLYTIAGTQADQWLVGVKANGLGPDRVYVHGMITYDYLSFVKAVRSKSGQWTNPSTYTKVDHPIALVLFGFPADAPWTEDQ